LPFIVIQSRAPVLFMLAGRIVIPIAHAARKSLDLFDELEDVIVISISSSDYLIDNKKIEG
jgi:hypothetical protein